MRILPLARSVVDPAAARRGEPLTALAARPGTRVVLVRSGRIATADDAARLDLRDAADLRALGPDDAPDPSPSDAGTLWFYLGEHEGRSYLGLLLPDVPGDAGEPADADRTPPDGPAVVAPDAELGLDLRWSTLREVGHLLDDRDADLATTAVALSEWHRRNARCPRCGAATRAELAGWVRRCPVDGTEEYPRTDAAVIMAVVDDDDRILLAHGARWAGRRFSTLAGFVEPGESLETAVRREVAEEVGVQVGDVAYIASQPWPFPASLMVAFRARALTTAIEVDAQEVTEARWFSRAELRAAVQAGDVTLPMRTSIALALIEQWFGGPLDAPQDW